MREALDRYLDLRWPPRPTSIGRVIGNRVLTLDAGDFGIVAREGSLVVSPE